MPFEKPAPAYPNEAEPATGDPRRVGPCLDGRVDCDLQSSLLGVCLITERKCRHSLFKLTGPEYLRLIGLDGLFNRGQPRMKILYLYPVVFDKFFKGLDEMWYVDMMEVSNLTCNG